MTIAYWIAYWMRCHYLYVLVCVAFSSRHLPDDGAVLSPYVEVFREGTNTGYSLEDKTTVLEAVVSVAMPNMNNRMSDSPVDANPNPEAYCRQLEQKWRAALAAAAFYTEADCVVVPDAGCGVFRNPPAQVGAALGRVLRTEFQGRFAEVVVAFPGGPGGAEFAAAAVAAFAGESKPANQKPLWEFSVQHGFEPFFHDCQDHVEASYLAFKAGHASAVARVRSRGKLILVDFEKMTQCLEGSDRFRTVRRRE